MGLGDFINQAKTAAQKYQENHQAAQEAEKARQQTILDGHMSPIETTINLQPGEQAFMQLKAKRMAIIETTVDHTKGKVKKKHLIGRKSKVNTTTTHDIETNVGQLDKGSFILTNRRIIFTGTNVISLPYDQILNAEFKRSLIGATKAIIKYPNMENGEFFELSGDAKDVELYYRGIIKK